MTPIFEECGVNKGGDGESPMAVTKISTKQN
jgi:hypothetical protein